MKFPLRFARVLLVLVALGAFGGLTWSTATWMQSDTPPPAALPPRLIPDTDVNPYGANFFLDREVEEWKRDRTVRMASEAGIVWAKQEFSWEEIEKRKNQFDWDKYDQIVATFEKYGLQIIARLDRPPAWAHKDTSIPQGPPDNLDDYGDFVDAFVRRYQGRIHYVQVWNEPNIFPEWGNRPVDPAAYVQLLKVAYTRAKAADPYIRVLSAPLAITLGEAWAPWSAQWRNMDDLDYLAAMYRGGAKDHFDILSANAFGLRATPDDPPDPKQLNFQRVALDRQIMVSFSDTNKAIWINEYGWNASPAEFSLDKLIWGRVTEQLQADYTVRGITQGRDQWPWVGVFNIWYFRQVGDIRPDSSDYYFRMVDVDFTPRLVYLRLKDAATFRVIAQPGFYQETNQAVDLRGPDASNLDSPWQPYLNPRSSAGGEMVTRQPGARADIHFWGDGLDLLMRRGPTLGRAWITLDGRKVPDLPLDANGNSYVDLSSPNDEFQVVVPVAHDIARGTHSVEIVVGQSGEVALDAFAGSADGLHEVPFLPVLAFGGLFFVALALFMQSLGWSSRRAEG